MVKVWRPKSGDVFKYPEQAKKSKFKQIAKVSFLTALGGSVLALVGFLFNDRANLGSNIKDLQEKLEEFKNTGKDFSQCKTINECNERLNHLEKIVKLDDDIISKCEHRTGMSANELSKLPWQMKIKLNN